MKREGKEANELIHRPLTRARAKKMKAYDGSLATGMVVFIEETMKTKNEGFKDEGKLSKLLIICTISEDYSMEQVEGGEKQSIVKLRTYH